jgi:hypothetical protein
MRCSVAVAKPLFCRSPLTVLIVIECLVIRMHAIFRYSSVFFFPDALVVSSKDKATSRPFIRGGAIDDAFIKGKQLLSVLKLAP